MNGFVRWHRKAINFINACDDRVIYGVFSAVKRNVLMPDRGFNIFH